MAQTCEIAQLQCQDGVEVAVAGILAAGRVAVEDGATTIGVTGATGVMTRAAERVRTAKAEMEEKGIVMAREVGRVVVKEVILNPLPQVVLVKP